MLRGTKITNTMTTPVMTTTRYYSTPLARWSRIVPAPSTSSWVIVQVWMAHCHILEHAELEMMSEIEVQR